MLRRTLAIALALTGLIATTTPASPAPDRVAEALGDQLRGMALNDVGATRSLDTAVVDFPRMAAEGITSVTAYLYLSLRSPDSSKFAVGVDTPTDAELEVVSKAAALSGLKVDWMPVLLNNTTGGFRGDYQPTDVGAFFASYTAQLVHYADLAQKLNVSLLYVGSENNDLAGYTNEWRALIHTVRQHYSGALTYMATAYSALDVHFWDALDLAAISPYFSLGPDAVPTYDRMLSAWTHDHLPYVAKVAKQIGKPLIFGEVGYHSQLGTYTGPAQGGSVTDLPTPQAQADAYAALLDALKGAPEVRGVTWFRWGQATTVTDTSFSPAGKPAECVIAQHWSTDPTVRKLASLPVCDLSVLDSIAKASDLS